MRLTFIATTISVLLSSTIVHSDTQASSIVLTDTSEQLYRYDDSGNPYYSESGVSGEEVIVHIGTGEAMPLGLIAELIVPESWHINIPTQKVANLLVSASGGKSWSHVLRELAEKEQIYVSVDWTSKKVSMDASDKAKARMAAPNSKVRTADALQQSNNVAVLSYADTLQKKKEKREQEQREMIMKQELVNTTSRAAAESIDATERKLGEVSESNLIAKNENARLARELEAAKMQINTLSDRLSVVGEGENTPVAEDLFGDYQDADVLPFNATFDYYIKGGYLDKIEYKTPATYIAKPGDLEDVLRGWAEKSGFDVQWKTPVSHKITHKLQFKGDLREVSIELFELYLNSNRPLNISFYPDVGESGLIVVDELNSKPRSTPSLNWVQN